MEAAWSLEIWDTVENQHMVEARGVRGNKRLGVHGIGHEMPDGPSGVDRAGGEGPVTEAEDDADWSRQRFSHLSLLGR